MDKFICPFCGFTTRRYRFGRFARPDEHPEAYARLYRCPCCFAIFAPLPDRRPLDSALETGHNEGE